MPGPLSCHVMIGPTDREHLHSGSKMDFRCRIVSHASRAPSPTSALATVRVSGWSRTCACVRVVDVGPVEDATPFAWTVVPSEEPGAGSDVGAKLTCDFHNDFEDTYLKIWWPD
jgi:hypothetical protein